MTGLREIVVTHEVADLDGFAAAVAATKVYPEARVVLASPMSGALRDFLALHKDRFEVVLPAEVDQARISKLIVVDVRRAGRLAGLCALVDRVLGGDSSLQVHIYDHHGPGDDDLPGAVERVERVGSATTLLVELVRARAIEVDPVEATLFALGVMADTGALLHPSSTARDAEVLAWLYRQGARVEVIARYLDRPLTGEQRSLLGRLLQAVVVEPLGSDAVGFALATVAERVDGLAEVAEHLLGAWGLTAVFVVCEVEGRWIDVVGRSRSQGVDVGRALMRLGGGGHAGAGAAKVPAGDPTAVRERLLDALRAAPPVAPAVGQLMTTPALSVRPRTPLLELERLLEREQITGVPVLREGRLVGVISRRDLRRAKQGGRGHLAVDSCMQTHVRTTTPSAPAEAALFLMQRADVGRLPVLEGEEVVGVVTRSDLIRSLYNTRG